VAGVNPPRRGEIWWVTLDPVRGSEIGKTRPAVVVSNDACNSHGSRVVVLPLTGNVDHLFPGEARITAGGRPARALGDQIRAVARERLTKRIGRLSSSEVEEVEGALRITLGL
jgi:mRNA interferase MazF